MAFYQTASEDGSRVFFTSNETLTDDPSPGLYMWERQASDEQQSLTVDATGGDFRLDLPLAALDRQRNAHRRLGPRRIAQRVLRRRADAHPAPASPPAPRSSPSPATEP